MIHETKYEAIELFGGVLAISAYDQNDTELFRWEGDAETCPIFIDAVPMDYTERTEKDLLKFIDTEALIAWAWRETRTEQRTHTKAA